MTWHKRYMTIDRCTSALTIDFFEGYLEKGLVILLDQIRVEGVRLLSCWLHLVVFSSPGKTLSRAPLAQPQKKGSPMVTTFTPEPKNQNL